MQSMRSQHLSFYYRCNFINTSLLSSTSSLFYSCYTTKRWIRHPEHAQRESPISGERSRVQQTQKSKNLPKSSTPSDSNGDDAAATGSKVERHLQGILNGKGGVPSGSTSSRNKKSILSQTNIGGGSTAAPQQQKASENFSQKVSNNFVNRLNFMNARYSKLTEKNEERKKKLEEIAKKERAEMLTFRDVDRDLDRVIIGRDMFLWGKCLYRGIDFVVDQFLERELRYYTETANHELRIAPKLFRGSPYLVKKKNGITFPSLSLARMSHIVPMSKPSTDPNVVQEDEKNAAVDGSNKNDKEESGIALQRYGSKNERRVSISAQFFKRPTVVVMSQLGGKGGTCDQDWLKILDHYFERQQEITMGKKKGQGEETTAAQGNMGNKYPRWINHMVIRSIDQTGMRMIRRYVVNRYASFLKPQDRAVTYVGDKVIRKFTPDFALRNFLSSYCLLVDHDGIVRWMSAGPPGGTEEIAIFMKHLKQLEYEYLKSI